MKLIILIQSCDKDRFKKQANVQKRAIIRQIERCGLIDKISVYDYIGNSDTTYLKDSTIYVNADDSLNGTFEKTIKCFEYINNNFDYDIILRTNTSTFINIYLLFNLLNIIFNKSKLLNEEFILCGDLMLKQLFMCPAPKHIEIRGNSMMFTNKMINILLENKDNFVNNKKYPLAGNIIEEDGSITYGIDDICISSILNIYFENKGENLLQHIFYYKHLYTYNMLPDTNFYKSHEAQEQLYNFAKSYISLNIKRDQNEDDAHLEDIILLDDLFREKIDMNLVETIKSQFEYNKNVMIFKGFEYKHSFIQYKRQI